MGRRTTPLPQCLRGRVFTRAEALGSGLTANRLRGPAVRRLHRDVYVDADTPLTVDLRIDAALLAVRDSAPLVAGQFAARCWALPEPLRAFGTADPLLTAPVTIAVSRTSRRDDRDGIDVAEVLLPPEHLREWRGRQLLAPARLFVDLAESWQLEDLVAFADAALHNHLVTVEELERAVEWAWHRRGVVLARLALTLVDPAAESPMESRLRLLLVLAGLPRPEANRAVRVGSRVVARPDLRYPEYRLAIEYDGEDHADASERSRDERRRVQLRELGWVVLSFTREEVLREPWLVVARVASELRARGATW